MSGHDNCCKGRKVPKTRAQFAALNYPPNTDGHHDVKNRLQNPREGDLVDYSKTKATRKGWWFPLKQENPGPPLLDGSGDGQARGFIIKSNGVVPRRAASRLICLNACNLKTMPVPVAPGKTELRQCGFTWNVKLHGQSGAFSGWMPIAAIKFTNATAKERVLNALRSWACCMEKYEKWGRALTRPNATRYVFRSVAELEAELAAIPTSAEKFKRYFRDNSKGSVKKQLVIIAGKAAKRDELNNRIGILSACKNGNKLTDYLPKGADAKSDQGYTNLSANISIGSKRPTMAPIGLDILPAGHSFYRVQFKDGKAVLGYIFRVPKSKSHGDLIGRVVWYYGYVDIVSGDKKQRRYGWVPALAVRKP
ncbi:hypothetical protein [Polyangium aurulentum]|uniref:hypothetical protein n=1 Tax=Polyangium aurulentum TaxID=2567896 RepID=UPI0010AE2E0F|nr:hypothetical protein [Polyangium aurulentum]UQA60659.1 hypothetical protein E8A73_009350 [Polyangium aurulentum]